MRERERGRRREKEKEGEEKERRRVDTKWSFDGGTNMRGKTREMGKEPYLSFSGHHREDTF